MQKTTIYLSGDDLSQIEAEKQRTGRPASEIIRAAIGWYFAMREAVRDGLGELESIYEELPREAIIARLVADDRRRRQERNTKELIAADIKADTTAIREIVEREFGGYDHA